MAHIQAGAEHSGSRCVAHPKAIQQEIEVNVILCAYVLRLSSSQ